MPQRRRLLLDAFCKAGGASVGYARAGFQVIGVDLHPQPRYPFPFVQAEAVGYIARYGYQYDAIHASPPCQGYTAMRHAPGALGAPRLIEVVRQRLVETGRPYIIENVPGAPLQAPLVLCGSMFGLGAQGCWLQRHRLFETSVPLVQPACAHPAGPVIGVYGGHARRRAAGHGGRGTRDIWQGGHRAAAAEALGIDWMTLEELSEAIPPAFTEYVGRRLLEVIDPRARAETARCHALLFK